MAEETVTPRPEWNATGADHDRPYIAGQTDLYLIPSERSRLTMLRAGIRAGKFPGELIADPTKGATE